MSKRGTILVGVAYATLAKQLWLRLVLPEGSTVRDAITKSGILDEFTDIDLDAQKVGIFGMIASLDDTLKNGDRVEIYRPITADPSAVRRRNVDRNKS
ncbi:MAG TPA: RnfH family protein [Hyphomicrobiales bacterium]|nr:RnfH family protein [Rhodobiaceae bacterium]HXK54563.1 RnfH family protein [Hyphomicrobiales bacterium]